MTLLGRNCCSQERHTKAGPKLLRLCLVGTIASSSTPIATPLRRCILTVKKCTSNSVYDTILLRTDQFGQRVIRSPTMQRRILIAAAFIILTIVGLVGRRSDYVGASAQAPAIAACSPIPPPPCKEG